MDRNVLAAVGTMCLAVLCGCGDNSQFGKTNAKYLLEDHLQVLEAEQVVLSREQVECGVKEELWDPPVQVSQERTTAKLTPRGRELKFDDDVVVTETGFKLPYVQVRGELPVEVVEVIDVTDGPNGKLKFVEAKVGVKVKSACFATALPLMGVKRSKFNPEVNPVFQVSFDGQKWKTDKIRH